ncbi:hypothetical protein LXM94_00110 [Rhizobium sp. TRM95111]|uniref:hypothetical protein n=1 Tax=Rhizobium alarense TaxID=2846851 RepID=UPI001F2429E4|nr:hypothetical protein [Rhizobium alarense]MCF3638372.1 hypothetical protein [Rhizobium alarense]
MSQVDAEEEVDKPLDPVMENVRRKMVRLQLVSGGIMLLMFMAVLAAIVYKVTATEGKSETAAAGLAVPSSEPLRSSIALPQGFNVAAVSQSGGQVLFYGLFGDGTRKLLAFDMATGRAVADIDVTGE